jgi:glycosyltransferase involved in cell wall biosynthesis
MVSALWGPAYPTGSGVYAYEIAKRLAESGHEVDVYTSQVGNFNGTKYPPNMHLKILRTYGFAWDMNPIANVFNKLVGNDYDIVHVHSYVFCMSNTAAMARAFRDFGYVLNFHGGVSHCDMDGSTGFRFMAKEQIFDRTIGMLTVKLADKVISIAKRDVPLIREKFGVESSYVPNAVCTDLFTPGSNGHEKVVTYVGKLEKWKGTEDLLKIFEIVQKEVEDVKFMVVGNGSLQEKVRSSGLPIKMTGFVPHSKIPTIYHGSAVSVLPSYMEGCPTTCMESLACGVPCVATNVGDTQEIVLNGKTGYLETPGDINGVAARIIELLQDETLRRRMGAEGREHIANNYSYSTVMKKMLEVYGSITQ